ncbi:MAG: heat-inducible transcriptional repressor HrcA [Acutalibacteraceae bacterium]
MTSSRKEKILSAVVESFIESGEPVGSKALQEMLDLNVSSATIRNELAYLEQSGYLVQPHTSAGRIPTEKGYRYYIDNLMPDTPLNHRGKAYIDERLYKKATCPEDVLKEASSVISELTGLVSVSTTPPSHNARIHKISFVQTGRQTGMTVLVTSTGIVKSRLFRTEFVLSSKLLSVFDRALNDKMDGMPLIDVNMAFIQSTATSFGELSLFMPNILLSIAECCEEANHVTVYLSGQSRLLSLSEYDIHSVRNILRFLSNKNQISSLLMKKPNGTGVFVGTESGHPELTGSGIIVSRYNLNGSTAGAIGTIGPIRTDYKKNMAINKYISEKVGEIITELLDTA